MWNLHGLVQPPTIACFQTFDQTLTTGDGAGPSGPHPSRGARALLKKLHGPTKTSAGLQKALAASQAGDANAPLLWKAALQKQPAADYSTLEGWQAKQRQKKREALEQPVEGHATLIEALLASGDWASMAAVAYHMPHGSYADGRVSNRATWFGGAQGGLAHGPVIVKKRLHGRDIPPVLPASMELATHFEHGKPAGACTYMQHATQAQLHAQYAQGKRIPTATYTQDSSILSLHIEGPWIGEAEQAVPQGAQCTWTSNQDASQQHFTGIIHCAPDKPVVESSYNTYVPTRPPPTLGQITQLNGKLTLSGSHHLVLEGDFTSAKEPARYQSCGQPLHLCGRGTLTLSASSVPHPGSVDVARGYVTGIWKDDALVSGEGEVTLLDGTHYQGQFGADGAYHGTGTLTQPSGVQYQGQFSRGDIVEEVALTWPGGEKIAGTLRRPPTSQAKTAYNTGVITFVNGTQMELASPA